MTFVDSKGALNPPIVYSTNRSKAVILVFFLFFLWLCSFYYWSVQVESCLAFCSRVFSVLFSIVVTSLGIKRSGTRFTKLFMTELIHKT